MKKRTRKPKSSKSKENQSNPLEKSVHLKKRKSSQNIELENNDQIDNLDIANNNNNFDDDNANQEFNKNEEILTIIEEIHQGDTIATFYNRVQNIVFDKFNVNPQYKFILLIQSKVQILNDEQKKIISEPIPSDYEIPLITPPIFLTIGNQSLPPIKASSLIDNGFRTYEIDTKTGIKTIQNQLLTLSDTQSTFLKRSDDPNSEKDHSYVLNLIRYGALSVNDIKLSYPKIFKKLSKNGFVKNKKLTSKGEFSSEFEDFLFYELVILNSYIESQNENDRSSAFLFSLLIFQIIRNGFDIVDNFYADSFVSNFDECSDLVTLIKVIFPFLKFDRNGSPDGYLNEKSKYVESGLNPEIGEVIVSFISVNFKVFFCFYNQDTEDDNDDRIYNEYCEAVDRLHIFLFNINSKIDEFIKIVEQSLPKFVMKREFSFVSITKSSNSPSISVKMKAKDKSVAFLNNRPGWLGYSIPKRILAFCITTNLSTNNSSISIIHSIGKEMEISSIRIPEELDNVFTKTIMNSILYKGIFHPLFENKNQKSDAVYIENNTIRENYSFISYRPKINEEKQCKTEINNSINLLKILNPFIPRSLLFLNKDLSLLIELQSSGLSNIHSRVYSCEKDGENQKKAKSEKGKNCPFYELPYAYQINKESLNFLWNNIDELKSYSPSIRIALNSSDFLLFGKNRKQNESRISEPRILDNCRYVLDCPSHLFILSDTQIPELGKTMKFETFEDLPTVNVFQSIAMTLPESCKISSECFMFVVNVSGSAIIVNMNHKERKVLEKSLNKNIFEDSKSKKLSISLTQFLNSLEGEIKNIDQFLVNISFESENNGFPMKSFSFDEIKRSLAELLQIENSKDLIDIVRVGQYCFYLKITKMVGDVNDDDETKERKIAEAIRTVTDEYGEVDVSHYYNLFTFSFPVLENQGLVYKDRFDQIYSQITPKFYPFLFDKLEKDAEMPQYGVIKLDVFSQKAAVELAKLIKERFKDEILTKAIDISYPHPILKEHQQTKEKVDNWILANNDKLRKEGAEWVGSISDVEKLQKQFKVDLENKVFQFDYLPFFVPVEKFKETRQSLEKDGFQDYEYSKLYELLIIKPEKFDHLDQIQTIEADERKFCLHVCKGSSSFRKRLPLYDLESDGLNSIYVTFCEECVYHSIREITKDYFTRSDVMNDASKIIYKAHEEASNQLETKWRPLDFLLRIQSELKIGRSLTIPIGQFLWFLIDQSSQKVNPFIRAWLCMAADVAVRQCQMITACPSHLSHVVKLSKSSSDVLKCGCDGNCLNYFHMKCLRWHGAVSDDAENGGGKKKCNEEAIGFDMAVCPNCNVQSLNLFNNIIVFCDRCGCNWCFLCKTRIEKEKIARHIREFHDNHLNL